MTTRSIILPDILIRAALAGRVSEIRLPMKPQPDIYICGFGEYEEPRLLWPGKHPPATQTSDRKLWVLGSSLGQPGDRLVVRETWAAADTIYGDEKDVPQTVAYRADKSARVFAWGGDESTAVPDWDLATWGWDKLRWRSSTQMPLWASRLTFDVIASRVERCQDITEEGAKASGVDAFFTRYACIGRNQRLTTGKLCADAEHRASFAVLWDERFGDVVPWSANPWTWVATVRRS